MKGLGLTSLFLFIIPPSQLASVFKSVSGAFFLPEVVSVPSLSPCNPWYYSFIPSAINAGSCKRFRKKITNQQNGEQKSQE